KLYLVRTECLLCEESCQRLLGGPAVHAHEGPNEQTQALRLALRAVDVLGHSDAALNEHSLQLVQIGCSECLVHPQFVDRDVILMSTQVRLRLRPELRVVRPLTETRQCDVCLTADHILKVGVD